MKWVRQLSVIALGFSLLGLTSCRKAPILGILLPTSGKAATYGQSMSDAMHLALAEARQDGSVPAGFKAVWADSASDPQTGVAAFKKLVDESGARMVIGGCTSDVAEALLPVMKKKRIIVLSPSASAPDLTKKSKLFYRLFPSDELEGVRAGTFLYQGQGKRNVLIFSAGDQHARGIEPEFRHQFEQNLGGTIAGRIVLTDVNWQNDAADVLTSAQPDAAYVIGYATETVEVLRFLRKQRFSKTVCATSALYDRAVLDANKGLVEGVFFPLPSFDPQSDKAGVHSFVKAYRDRFGSDPDIFAAHAYDAMNVALFVLKTSKYLETEEILKTMQFGVTDFPGITGMIRFDDYGDVHHIPIMYIVKGGKVLNFERYRKQQLQRIKDRLLSLTRQ